MSIGALDSGALYADSRTPSTRMCNNAGTGGTESAGKVHEMSEKTWDFTMWVFCGEQTASRFAQLLKGA